MLEKTHNTLYEGHIVDYKKTVIGNDGEPCSYLYVQSRFPTAVIHNDIIEGKLSSKNIRLGVKAFKEMKVELAELGFTLIAVFNTLDSGDKWDRYIKLFGFPEPTPVKLSAMEISWD